MTMHLFLYWRRYEKVLLSSCPIPFFLVAGYQNESGGHQKAGVGINEPKRQDRK